MSEAGRVKFDAPPDLDLAQSAASAPLSPPLLDVRASRPTPAAILPRVRISPVAMTKSSTPVQGKARRARTGPKPTMELKTAG